MPSEQPGPVLAVIAVVALIAMAGSVYIGVTAQMSAGHTAVASSEAATPAN